MFRRAVLILAAAIISIVAVFSAYTQPVYADGMTCAEYGDSEGSTDQEKKDLADVCTEGLNNKNIKGYCLTYYGGGGAVDGTLPGLDPLKNNACLYGTRDAIAPADSEVTGSTTCEEYGKNNGTSDEQKTKLEDICEDGYNKSADTSYCTELYADFNSKEYGACTFGQKVMGGDDSGDEANEEDSCTASIVGIGWFVCPALNFMAGAIDMSYAFLSTFFLEADANSIEDTTFNPWSKFRDIANVVFVIVIVFIIYSQLTSFGLSNYGIKRMLPKLIVAALLVNLSFYICLSAVDLTNLVGYAIPNLLDSTVRLGEDRIDPEGNVVGSILGSAGAGLAWVTVFAGAGALIFAIGTPVVVAALLAVALIVFILIARQAIIVLLIVISPLAFVAYLLPNTEQWFKKWYKTFGTMLLLFPIVGIVFGASQLAANIIYNASATGVSANINQLIALATTAIPFFVVPGLLKGSLNALGSIGNKMQGLANKATGNVGAKVKSSSRLGTGLADMKKFREQQRAIKYAKRRGRGVMGVIGRTPIIGGGKKYNEKARSRANQLELSEHAEDVKASRQDLEANRTYEEINNIATGKLTDGVSEIERQAAIESMMEKGNFQERQAVLRSAGGMTSRQRKAAVNGAFAKGDGAIYGSSTLGTIMDAEANLEHENADVRKKARQALDDTGATLDAGFADKINSKGIKAAMFHKDDYTAKYIEQQLDGYVDEKGNAHGPNSAIVEEEKKAFAKSLNEFALTEEGRAHTENTDTGARAAKILANNTKRKKLQRSVINPKGF